jgi:hypothetical protein
MDTKNQLAVFLACVFVGFLGGAIYEPFSACRKAFKKLGVLFDLLFFAAFSVLFCFFCAVCALPPLRVYMPVGALIGLIIYLKSLHRIVAILEKLCYNCFIKLKNRLKKLPKKQKGARSNTEL